MTARTLAELKREWDEYAVHLQWAEDIADNLPGVVEGFIEDHGGHGRIQGELLSIDLHRMYAEGDAMDVEQWYYNYSSEAYDRARGLVRDALGGILADMDDLALTDELVERVSSMS